MHRESRTTDFAVPRNNGKRASGYEAGEDRWNTSVVPHEFLDEISPHKTHDSPIGMHVPCIFVIATERKSCPTVRPR